MNSNGIVLTADILDQGLSMNGAYNYEQLRVLGIELPPRKGWRQRLIGTTISPEAVDRFLALKDAHLPAEKRASQALPEEDIQFECRSCKCWEFLFEDNNQGHCHRYPHKIIKDADDWCLEFKPKQSL